MSSRRRAFPLVPDDEPVIGQSTSMHLYENADLITNIHGTYYDKDYAAVTPEISFVRQTKSDEAIKDETKPLERTAGRSYAEAAREKARDDLRQKRQFYVNHELKRAQQPTKAPKRDTPTSLKSQARGLRQSKMTKAEKNKPSGRLEALARAAQKLHQESYILVDLPKVYHKPEPSKSNKPQKNTFDFLKRSQVYNHKERQERRERQVAQELNLTRFDD